MAWQGRNVTLRIGNEVITPSQVLSFEIKREPVEVTTDDNEWSGFMGGEITISSVVIKRIMKTKGRQPRAVAVRKEVKSIYQYEEKKEISTGGIALEPLKTFEEAKVIQAEYYKKIKSR